MVDDKKCKLMAWIYDYHPGDFNEPSIRREDKIDEYFDSGYVLEPFGIKLYKQSDVQMFVETFRKELIEDIDNIFTEFASFFGEEYYNLESEYRSKVKEIINRRVEKWDQ
jgi:hypothetical protein